MNTLLSRIRASLILLVVVILTYPISISAEPTDFGWASFDANGLTTYGVRDADNSTILQTGDLAQLIWVGPDNVANAPTRDGRTTGDDVWLDTSVVQNGESVSLPPPQLNKGYILYKLYNFDSAASESGKPVYIRAWNASSASAATAYGDSILHNLTSGEMYSWPRWYTDKDTTPLAVELEYFTATSKPDHVLLAWETVSELDVIGFNLHRGVSADGPWQKLNPQPIAAAEPGGTAGHAYTWVDSAAPRGGLYYYRLDEVLTDGSSNPVAVTSVSHGAGLRVWLPVTYR